SVWQMLSLARQALRLWTLRQVAVAVLAGAAVALLIGVATVLIPNPVFGRDIPPVWWNYPVWILTSAITGMLISTYVRPGGASRTDDGETHPGAPASRQERRTSRFGMAGTLLAWFAVG